MYSVHTAPKRLRSGFTGRVCTHTPRNRTRVPRKMQPESRCPVAAPPQLRPPPPEPAPAPAPPSVPRLELTHRRHLLCLGAGDSRSQDPGEETLAQHLPAASAAPRDSSNCCSRDRLHPEQATPLRVTSDRRPHHAPQGTRQRRRGLRPQHARQWFRPALAAPRGGASSFSSGLHSLGAWAPPARRRCPRIPGGGRPLTRERLAPRRRGS